MKATQVRAVETSIVRKCCICHKEVEGYYGSWRNGGGTCSRTCEGIKEDQEYGKSPEVTESAQTDGFYRRPSLSNGT